MKKLSVLLVLTATLSCGLVVNPTYAYTHFPPEPYYWTCPECGVTTGTPPGECCYYCGKAERSCRLDLLCVITEAVETLTGGGSCQVENNRDGNYFPRPQQELPWKNNGIWFK
jgi:hypothetical protein